MTDICCPAGSARPGVLRRGIDHFWWAAELIKPGGDRWETTGQDPPQLQMLSGSDEPAARPDRAARPPPTPPTAPSEGVHRQGPGGRPAGSWVGPLRSRSVRAFGGWCHAAGRKPLSQSYTSWCNQPTARDRSLKRRDHPKKARSRARSSLTWGFAAPQIPPYPLNTPPRSTPSGYCSTRKVRARVVRQTRVVLLVSHLGVSIPIEFLYLVAAALRQESPAIWSANVAAQTVRLTVRLSGTWGLEDAA